MSTTTGRSVRRWQERHGKREKRKGPNQVERINAAQVPVPTPELEFWGHSLVELTVWHIRRLHPTKGWRRERCGAPA